MSIQIDRMMYRCLKDMIHLHLQMSSNSNASKSWPLISLIVQINETKLTPGFTRNFWELSGLLLVIVKWIDNSISKHGLFQVLILCILYKLQFIHSHLWILALM